MCMVSKSVKESLWFCSSKLQSNILGLIMLVLFVAHLLFLALSLWLYRLLLSYLYFLSLYVSSAFSWLISQELHILPSLNLCRIIHWGGGKRMKCNFVDLTFEFVAVSKNIFFKLIKVPLTWSQPSCGYWCIYMFTCCACPLWGFIAWSAFY